MLLTGISGLCCSEHAPVAVRRIECLLSISPIPAVAGLVRLSCHPFRVRLRPPGRLFRDVIENARVPVLVDFWAAWCGPCKMAAPEVEALAKEMAGRLIVLKVDMEREPGIAAQFRIQSIPNFIIFRNGQTVFQRAGAAPRSEMQRWVESQTAQA